MVRKAETDEIKYKVWMGSDYKQRKYYCTLASSWGRNATFNFAALDMMFPDIKGTEHKIRVALNRIRYPEKLSNAQRDEYIAYLVRCAKDLITRCIDCGDMETLLFCEPFGVIKKSNIENIADYAVQKKPFNSRVFAGIQSASFQKYHTVRAEENRRLERQQSGVNE